MNLNTNYLNNIGSTWLSKIANHPWQVGGNTWANIGNITVKNAYTNEIVSPSANATYDAKIGLIYVSDYGYAASPAAWTLNMNGYNNSTATSNNWMFMGLYEWTISRRAGTTDGAFPVSNAGNVDYNIVHSYYAVRPSFYLESSVELSGGDGSQENPFRIVV